MLIDANTITDKELNCQVCIIGSGPAGTSLANELAKSGLDVIVAESGGKYAEVKSNKLNQTLYKSNFTFRTNFANRHRQVGGAANLWAGRVVPFKFEPGLDDEWGAFPQLIEPFKKPANKLLGVSDDIITRHPDKPGVLTAFWGKKNQKFNFRSPEQAVTYKVVYHLTFNGNVEESDGTFKSFSFINGNGEVVKVVAARFVLAAGGMENPKLMLLMQDKLQPLMKENFYHVGRYFMEHPKITHGDLTISDRFPDLDKFRLKIERDGKVKYGLKNLPDKDIRVYTNLVDEKSDLVAKVYAKIANIYKALTNKVYTDSTAENKSADLIKDLIYLLEPEELLPHYLLYKFSNVKRKQGGSYRMKLITYLEQLPDADNQVVLSKELKDANGVPVPELKLNISDSEIDAVIDFYNQLTAQFSQYGGKLKFDEQYLRDRTNYTEASHHIGSTRYSTDINKRVVNEDLKVVGTQNLYVAGSSVFPTSGVENPTYLIVCLSCYLSSVIAKSIKN